MSDWTAVTKLIDIPRMGARVVNYGELELAVFRTIDDEVFALKDSCPHKGGPLSQGIVHGTSVTCPLHNWKIDLDTGNALAPDQGCTHRYPLKIDNGMIFLQLQSTTAAE